MDYKSLEKRILKENYTDFFDSFCEDFKKNINELKEKTIDIGEKYYRARIGNDILEAAIDDFNILPAIPYFGSDIEAPPAKFVRGGRFNREGISYLYLADNIETCIAEVHLQVGQICSIAQFECVERGRYIFVEKQDDNNEIADLYNILTKPVHSDIKEYYLVTQFFADVFKKIGYDGMIFFSTQATGKNIVSFNKDYFKFVKYSENMYRANKIFYEYEMIEDEYKKYSDYRKYLGQGNIYEEEKRESKYQYIQDKISYEEDRMFEVAKKNFDVSNDVHEFIETMRHTRYVQETYEYIGAFYLNKKKLEDGVKCFYNGLSSFSKPNLEKMLKRIESCEWVEQRENYKEASVIKKVKKIYKKLEKENQALKKNLSEQLKKCFIIQ